MLIAENSSNISIFMAMTIGEGLCESVVRGQRLQYLCT